MNSAQVREHFLNYFNERGHTKVASSSLVPGDDPSLMFTNAGMVQFKDVFLGFDRRSYDKAVTSQRCLRAGGKHNDLENVGYTARHHTFFEMLGNFSFGDYFKEKAIELALDLLILPVEKGGYGLPLANLWVTVFGGGKLFGDDYPAVPADLDAKEIWHKTFCKAGFSSEEAAKRIIEIPTSDNFWMMGDTGPCGPCSEIFFNSDAKATRFEGEDEDKADTCVEIWNLVFMQFNRDAQGTLHDLPAPCVDTGMGLERLSAILQKKASNYETNLFAELVTFAKKAIEDAGGKADANSASLRVIADHIRAASYLIADRVLPSNEGRGYVLRRIIRRALRHGHQLGATKPFFATLAKPLVKIMGNAHPELPNRLDKVIQTLADEEERFVQTLNDGMKILTKVSSGKGSIDGATVFKLYDTYGFPTDLTASYARDNNIEIDLPGFEKELAKQQQRSRAASGFSADLQALTYDGPVTNFNRDPKAQVTGAITALYDAKGNLVDELEEGSEGMVVLSDTNFYAEAGGQVGDQGELKSEEGEMAHVFDTIKIRGDVHGHKIKVSAGTLALQKTLTGNIDQTARQAISRAHSATHLLHEALRRQLGDHVEQRGSLVEGDRLRFDFSHDKSLNDDDLKLVEQIMGSQVLANASVVIEEMSYDDGVKRGAKALFGEKYGDLVRVVQIDPEYSVELCGGTHVQSASEIGQIHIRSDEAIAAGIRRIEASTGFYSQTVMRNESSIVRGLSVLLKKPVEKILQEITGLKASLATLNKLSQKHEQQVVQTIFDKIYKEKYQGTDQKWLVEKVAVADVKKLKDAVVDIGKKHELDAVICISDAGTKPSLVIWANKKSIAKVDARELLKRYATTLGAKGGGSVEFAQAGGGDSDKIEETLTQAIQDSTK